MTTMRAMSRTTPVEQLMTRGVATAHPGDTLREAAARMLTFGVRHLPIVDGDQRLIGILSDRDVRSAVGTPEVVLEPAAARARLRSLKVADVMTRDPFTTSVDATLADVAHYLVEHRVGAVPVVDDERRVVGIVSYIDVIRALVDGSDIP
jgi:CBS domain-containing protein